MKPVKESVARLTRALRLDTPLIAVYDSPALDDFKPTVTAKGRMCCFAYFKHWLKGSTVVFTKGDSGFDSPRNGCPGAQIAFGLEKEYPPFMANFLTDGEGASMGEGLKARPEIAQDFIDRATPPVISGDTVLIGPLRVEKWESVKSVTFLVDPDRLSALMTLAAFWTSDPELITAPFSSGCGMLLRELINQDSDRVVIGCTDIAMRKYIPPEMLCLTVSPARFEQMLSFPDDTFLAKDWWNDLMDNRGRAVDGD